MFVDARTLPVGENLETDICIVGAGPAGIALALALSGSARRIILAESGGFESDPATQSLNDGESIGLSYRVNESRLRYFGGSGNHWAGNCRALDTRIFKVRNWLPHSGWPFAGSDLDRYHYKAKLLCGVSQHGIGVEYIRARGGAPVSWSEPLETAVWQVPFVKPFGERFRAPLGEASGLTVLLSANLVELVESDEGKSIDLARFASLTGARFTIRARCYVLACGGIENARLLLSMQTERNPGGLGNRYDLVGRFFTEHPEMSLGALVHNRPGPPGLGRVVSTSKEQLLEGFRLTDSFQKNAQIGDVAFWPLCSGDVTASSELVAELGCTIQDVASRLAGLDPCGLRNQTILTITFEQSPNPDSRITLSDERDVLGMRRVRLDWRLNDFDRRTFATALKVIGRESGRQHIGRFWLRTPLRCLDLDRPESIRFDLPISSPTGAQNQLDTELCWGCHHMGTTRMHSDPRHGVVDPNSRVHGITNLYIAGSSIYPSVGISNPTLTIIALALRLADHLRETKW
jgi:choline dehydrogenase-like flavoprotein